MLGQPKQVESAKGRCCVSGRELTEGEEFFSALFEEGDSFRRADYSREAWTGPPDGCFCYFRTKVPVRQKRKKTFIDDAALVAFFQRLAGESEAVRVQFRFVLALLLMRKRLLRYESSETKEGQESWRMTLPADGSLHQVVNPRLTDGEIEGVSQQLSAILHGDMGEWGNQGLDPSDDLEGQSVDAVV